MSTRYRVKRRGEEKQDGGYWWDETGLVLIETVKDGERRLFIKDGRTGDLYSCFENTYEDQPPKKGRDSKAQQHGRQASKDVAAAHDKAKQSDTSDNGFEDDIPF